MPHIPKPLAVASEATQAGLLVGLCSEVYGAWAVDTGGVTAHRRSFTLSSIANPSDLAPGVLVAAMEVKAAFVAIQGDEGEAERLWRS